MSVYVDQMMQCVPNRNWRYTSACHMIADRDDELIAFARKIGLKPEWIQRGSILVHFDLNENKRRQAVANGAIELTREQMGERIDAARHRALGLQIAAEGGS